MSQGRKSLDSSWIARRYLDAIPKASQFSDHLARSHLLRFGADGRPPFFIAHALMQDLPDQPTQSVGDRPDGLSMPEARHEAAIDDGEDGAPGLHCGIGGLIENAPHLPIPLWTAMTVVHTGTLLVAG